MIKTLGQQLRIARDLRKLSLREVEVGTGISNAYLSQLENDKIKKPSPQFLGKLAALYNLDFQMLMEAAGYIDPKSASPGGPKSLAGATLWGQEDLTALEEEKLVDYLRFIRSQKT
jgi:transcriptional regulator with XRE-family HTH domain